MLSVRRFVKGHRTGTLRRLHPGGSQRGPAHDLATGPGWSDVVQAREVVRRAPDCTSRSLHLVTLSATPNGASPTVTRRRTVRSLSWIGNPAFRADDPSGEEATNNHGAGNGERKPPASTLPGMMSGPHHTDHPWVDAYATWKVP